jgi:hypothetical protein
VIGVLRPDVVERELYAELGELAAEFSAEARRHLAPIRNELERGAANIRLVRVMYWEGSISALAALDWLNSGRDVVRNVHTWDRP